MADGRHRLAISIQAAALTEDREIDITRISAVAEIISSVAIVFTLIYLTVETRQNTDALLANSRQAAMVADLTLMSNAIDNPDVGRALFAGLDSSRSDNEVAQTALVISFLRIREFLWFQYTAGLIDESAWLAYMGPAESVFSTSLAKSILETYRGDPEFLAYVRDFVAMREEP